MRGTKDRRGKREGTLRIKQRERRERPVKERVSRNRVVRVTRGRETEQMEDLRRAKRSRENIYRRKNPVYIKD